MITIGISVGTSRTGVAVLKDGELLDRHIHAFSSVWNKGKVKHITKCYRKYLEYYNVDAIIIKVPISNKQSPQLKTLIKKIVLLAKEYGCEYDLITKGEIKDKLMMRTTEQLTKYAVQVFPELLSLYDKGNQTKMKYNKKLYEAILSAYLYERRKQ